MAVPPYGVPAPKARVSVDAPRFWAGAVTTAVVAGLAALLWVLVFTGVFDVPILQSILGSRLALGHALSAGIAALIAAAVLNLLILSTPRPRLFFGWIVALATASLAVFPLAVTRDVDASLATGGMVIMVGLIIGTSLAAVAGRTMIFTHK